MSAVHLWKNFRESSFKPFQGSSFEVGLVNFASRAFKSHGISSLDRNIKRCKMNTYVLVTCYGQTELGENSLHYIET